MDTATIANIFGMEPSTGTNIFHEIAAESSMILLNRVNQFITRSTRFLLRERNFSGQQDIHIVAYAHKGQLAIDLMEKFLSLGANINAKNLTGGDSVLHVAVHNQNYELVTWMCQHPAIDRSAVNDVGWTAYRAAVERNDKKMIDILKKFGTDTKISIVYESDDSD